MKQADLYEQAYGLYHEINDLTTNVRAYINSWKEEICTLTLLKKQEDVLDGLFQYFVDPNEGDIQDLLRQVEECMDYPDVQEGFASLDLYETRWAHEQESYQEDTEKFRNSLEQVVRPILANFEKENRDPNTYYAIEIMKEMGS